MHGRPRIKGPPDPERVKAAQQKAALYGQLAGEVLERRRAGRQDPQSLALAAKLLELNPEVYTVWNYRREALAPVLAAGGDAALAAVAGELALTERAVLRNPKSYAAWHHRRWVVGHRFSSLEAELALVGRLLDADERNFHGWGYRRFVVGLMGTPAERELEYAERKINQNFSNYSAWHYRTTLLPAVHGGAAEEGGVLVDLAAALASAGVDPAVDGGDAPEAVASSRGGAGAGQAQQQEHTQDHGQQQQQAAGDGSGSSSAGPGAGSTTDARSAATEAAMPAAVPSAAPPASASAAVPREALDEEYELVRQAFFTEPEDQSGWFYHRWLLGCSLAHWEQARAGPEEQAERQALVGVLAREAQMCEELLEVEPEAKWPLLTLVRLRELQRTLALSTASGAGGGEARGAAASGAAGAAGAWGAAAADAGSEGSDEVAELYARLEMIDPLRRGYYGDAKSGRAHVVAAVLAPAGGGS